jgi:hypothetical protein
MTTVLKKIRHMFDSPCEDSMGTKDCSRCGESQQGRDFRCIATCTKTSRLCNRRYISEAAPFCLQHMVGTIRKPQPVWIDMSIPRQRSILQDAIRHVRRRKKSPTTDAYIRLFSDAFVPLYHHLIQSIGNDVMLKVTDFDLRQYSSIPPEEYPSVVRLHLDTAVVDPYLYTNNLDTYSRRGIDMSVFTKLRYLTIGDGFEKPLYSFPAGLQSLEVGEKYYDAIDVLPQSLKRLDLWRNSDGGIFPDQLPDGLTHLRVGQEAYHRALDGGVLPPTLTHLTLGNRYIGHRLTMANLPPRLTHLDVSEYDPLSRADLRVGLVRTIRPIVEYEYVPLIRNSIWYME